MWHNLFIKSFKFSEGVPPWVGFLILFIIYCKLVKAFQHFFITIRGVTLIAAYRYKWHCNVYVFIYHPGYVDLIITFSMGDDLFILVYLLVAKLRYLLFAYVHRLRIRRQAAVAG